MDRNPTSGMTAIGVLNIVLGLLACLGALLTAVVGGGLAVLGSAASEAGVEGADATAAGGVILLFGIAGLVAGLILFISGIGVLKVSPWGRTWSLIAAALAILRTLAEPILLATFGIGSLLGLAYPVLLIVLFMRKGWRQAFSTAETPTTAVPVPASDPKTTAPVSEPMPMSKPLPTTKPHPTADLGVTVGGPKEPVKKKIVKKKVAEKAPGKNDRGDDDPDPLSWRTAA